MPKLSFWFSNLSKVIFFFAANAKAKIIEIDANNEKMITKCKLIEYSDRLFCESL